MGALDFLRSTDLNSVQREFIVRGHSRGHSRHTLTHSLNTHAHACARARTRAQFGQPVDPNTIIRPKTNTMIADRVISYRIVSNPQEMISQGSSQILTLVEDALKARYPPLPTPYPRATRALPTPYQMRI